MAIEIQIREAVLAQAITEDVQRRVFTMCAPPVAPGINVDHLDTVPGSLAFGDVSNGVTVGLRVAIYVVSDADVMAHPNGTPDGAAAAAGEVGVTLTMAMVGTALTVVSAASDASGLPLPPAAQKAAKSVMDGLLAPLAGLTLFETQPVVAALSSINPAAPASAPALARGQGVVAVRFGAAGPVAAQLASGQGWGAFIDEAEARGLLTRQLPSGLPADVTWHPSGSKPWVGMHLNRDLDVGIDLGDINIDASVSVDLLLGAPRLRMRFFWDVDLTGLADLGEAAARKEIREQLRAAVDGRIPGVTHDGAQTFFFDVALPALPAFLQAEPSWGSIASSPAGMTVGGPVRAAPAANRRTLSFSVYSFGVPSWYGHCRETSEKPTEVPEAALQVRSGAGYSYAGALCSLTFLPPNAGLAANQSAEGLTLDLTVAVAEKITQDVRAVLATARGVRLVDLGRPRILRGADGKLLDVQIIWLKDCLNFSGVWLKLQIGEKLTVEDIKPEPHPNWRTILGADLGLNSHIVIVGGLEPGELATVRGPGLLVDVSADQNGVAMVPALVGLSLSATEVTVERLSRRTFDGPVQVETVEFKWLGSIGEAEEASVFDNQGTARIARRINGTVQIEDFDPAGERRFVSVDGQETSLNPQPLPPRSPEAIRIAEAAGLQEVASAQVLPGYSGRLVVAQLRDGTGVVVTANGSGLRVAGRYSGPLVGMQVDGGFAIARSGGQVHLFAMNKPEQVSFNG
jgi:hypothetical protein